MFGRPPCPNCGSHLLVARARTGGSYAGRPSEEFYRCSHTFTSADDPTNE